MGTGTGSIADIIGALVAIIGAGSAGGFMVVQAQAGTVTGIRVSAVCIGLIATGCTCCQVGVRTASRGIANIIGALVAIIGAGSAGGFMVIQAQARSVTDIGIGAVGIGLIATGCA